VHASRSVTLSHPEIFGGDNVPSRWVTRSRWDEIMSHLSWKQNDNIFTASILDYTAVIREQAGRKFTAHIQDHNKSDVREWYGDPVEFDEVERWALFSVIDLEQSGSKEVAQRGMLQTLDLCEPVLNASAHPSHSKRLHYIKEWILHRTTHEQEMAHVTKSPTAYSLQWSEESKHYFQASTPHGKASIIEEETEKSPYLINPTSRYKAQIEHSSGATYESLEIFMDFMNAEDWIQNTLVELDDPRISEFYLGNIHFTLNICKHSLPPDIEPVHITRLEYLEMLMDEFLL